MKNKLSERAFVKKHEQVTPKQYYFGIEVVWIEISKISTEKSEVGTEKSGQKLIRKLADADEIVKTSVSLYGYDNAAPPLTVYPDSASPGCYKLLDGFERIAGARKNSFVNKLPCVVIPAKNFAEARLAADDCNASIHSIRASKNFAAQIIETLNKSYRSRRLTKDLSLPKKELEFLAKLSGSSLTTCNRALAVFRDIYNEEIENNPNCAAKGLKKCFDAAAASGRYPELKDFLEKSISVASFRAKYAERVENLNSHQKSELEQSKKDCDEINELSGTAPKTNPTTVSGERQSRKGCVKSSEHSQFEHNSEITLIGRLKAMSSIDQIDILEVRAEVQKLLSLRPESKTWINLLARCVNQFADELGLTPVNGSPQIKSDHPKRSQNTSTINTAKADLDRLPLLQQCENAATAGFVISNSN